MGCHCARRIAMGWLCCLGLLAGLPGGPLARAATTYALYLRGPETLKAGDDGIARGRYVSVLRWSGDHPPPIKTWSFGVQAPVTGVTVAGTASDLPAGSGSAKAELTSRGLRGAVATVIFPDTSPFVFGEEREADVLIVDVEIEPGYPGFLEVLAHMGGLEGTEGPVAMVIEETSGRLVVPEDSSKTVPVHHADLCGDTLLGFSAENRNSAVPFDGILGGGQGAGDLIVTAARGAPGSIRVFANITTLRTFGSQGWSLSIALTGDAIPMTVSACETSAAAVCRGGFEQSLIVDPALNGGVKGFISSAFLPIGPPYTLLPWGTTSVLEMGLSSSVPLDGDDLLSRLDFRDGLRSSNRTFSNSVTIRGKSELPCNLEDSSLRIRFAPPRFRRADANGDGRVNIADAIHILEVHFSARPPLSCLAAFDANGDGGTDVMDALYLIQFQFLGGPRPPAPFPDCGLEGDTGLSCRGGQPPCS